MNIKKILIFICFILIFTFFISCGTTKEKPSFSFTELEKAQIINKNNNKDKIAFFKTNDNINLAYYEFKAKENQIASLIFLHGGGAYSLSGYEQLAQNLSDNNISTYLLALRGHGNSEGPRGDTPSAEQVWNDLHDFIEYVKIQNYDYPLFLGGHSSGCGLILNYNTYKQNSKINGFIFIAPEFGYKSNTENENIEIPFANVEVTYFVKNAISGGKEHGNTPAVFFNYPEDVLISQPLINKYITVNMSNAMTPDEPKSQFKEIDKPFGLFIGADDELLIPEKVIAFHTYANEEISSISISSIIKNKNHLSILLGIDIYIKDFINSVI